MNTYQGVRQLHAYKNFPLWASPRVHLLPDEHELVADLHASSLILVDWPQRKFIASCRFRDKPFSIIYTLLERWPSYVPYELLLPLLDITLSETDREQLKTARISNPLHTTKEQQAQGQRARKNLRPILKPLRTTLNESHSCLHTLGLTITEETNYGLRLIAYNPSPKQEE